MNPDQQVKISFVGDISLNDEYIHHYNAGENPFHLVEDHLKSSDLVVGNLECMIKNGEEENILKRPRLKTSSDAMNYLQNINIGVLSLANNHVYDHLETGFQKTISKLNELSINFLGASIIKDQEKMPLYLEIKGRKFCFLSYVTEDTNPSLPDNAEVHLNLFNKQKARDEILKNRDKIDFLIILFHWGGSTEGAIYPHYKQPIVARYLIDCGADLIIGHHSHTFQPYEIYKNKYIFYSLGNFCFSDINFESHKIRLYNKYKFSSIVNIGFTGNEYKVSFVPFKNIGNYIIPKESGIKKIKFRQFLYHYFFKYRIFWSLYNLKYKYFDPLKYFLFKKDGNFHKKLMQLNFKKLKRFLIK